MSVFFLEFSPALVLVMLLVGFLLGMLLGYFFWGIYRGRANRSQLEVDRMNTNLEKLRATNRSFKTQLAKR